MHFLSQLINQLPTPAQIWDSTGKVVQTNPRFNELFGLPMLFNWEKHGISLFTDQQAQKSGVSTIIGRALQGMPTDIHSFKYDLRKNPHVENSDAEALVLFMNLRPLLDQNQDVQYVICMVADSATTDIRYEQELMRSQKMENVERLASGVAHEFNNIFTGIKGMTELIKDEVDRTSEIYEFADSIQQNISRGAELIQQLSSFAREVPIALRRKFLSQYLERALPLMQIQVQRRIQIKTDIRNDGQAMLDVNLLDQALANILHNSRDAMGGQGRVLITIDRLDPDPDPDLDFPAGLRWIMLEIADSGPGIPDELANRVLEPFFTTKERGKATGLGLSVTNRIIVSHNGIIQIGRSEELGGAAIKIFLPLLEEEKD